MLSYNRLPSQREKKGGGVGHGPRLLVDFRDKRASERARERASERESKREREREQERESE